jgi:hypothetical protein
LREHNLFSGSESNTSVLHILRGGLNFGLREALAQAYSWNNHNSAFISAQRARSADNEEDWVITESDYQKLSLKKSCSLVFGDVVATGTSLNFALHEVAQLARNQSSELSEILFFTIGGPRSHALVESLETESLCKFSSYSGSTVVYLEGIFAVATNDSKLSIKIDGTDLLRANSLLAPEFIESQYEDPSFPLERCTIYDAGSRAFDILEYGEDVLEYWKSCLELAKKGASFSSLLAERMPELDASKYSDIKLEELCLRQIKKANLLLGRI